MARFFLAECDPAFARPWHEFAACGFRCRRPFLRLQHCEGQAQVPDRPPQQPVNQEGYVYVLFAKSTGWTATYNLGNIY